MFELPESLEGLSAADLDALLSAARDEAAEIAADVASADLDRLNVLAAAVATLSEAQTALAVSEAAHAEAVATALAAIAPVEVEEVVEEVVAEAEAEVVAEAEAVVEEAATAVVAAVQNLPKPSAAAVARAAKKPVVKTDDRKVAIVASAGVPGLRGGQEVTILDMVKPAIARWGSYQGVSGRQQDELFSLKAPARDPRLVANGHNDQDVVNYATSEARLVDPETGKTGLLRTAAGGWCAPAEQKYDICTLAELDGIFDLPTISVPRGSISYFRQLDYATVAAAIAAGQFCFTNAELVAEPPVVKPCFEIPCAEPVEATLDACGLCLRAGLLQQKAFPELIAAWLELALIAHAHFLNARNIAETVALLGAPIVLPASFGAISALFDAVDLAATDLRAREGMGLNRTLEVVLPDWVPALLRSDYIRRQFTDGSEFTLGEVNAGFAARNLRVQWIKDWAGNDGGFGGVAPATVWPDTVQFMLYPAGAFVRGSEDIINVSTLVDSALLQTNRVQLLFIETATKVMPACGNGRLYEITVCPNGTTGGPLVGTGSNDCPIS